MKNKKYSKYSKFFVFLFIAALFLPGLILAQTLGEKIQARKDLLDTRAEQKSLIEQKISQLKNNIQEINNIIQRARNRIVEVANTRIPIMGNFEDYTGPLPKLRPGPAPTVGPSETLSKETAATQSEQAPTQPQPVVPSMEAALSEIPSVQFVVATTSNSNVLTASPAANTPSSTLQELAQAIQSLPVPENPNPVVNLTSNATATPTQAPAPAATPSIIDQVLNFLNPFEPAFPTVVGPTPSVQSPQLVNTPVVWTAQGTGGSGNYEYQFVVRAAGSTQWLVVKPYSSSNSYLWTPSDPGVYSIGINIRNHGSSRATEDFKEATYVIAAPPVSASLSLSQNFIVRGQSVTLSWLSSNTNWCDITDDASSPDIGRVGGSGSRSVSPSETTTYNLVCIGDGGTVQQRIILGVTAPAPLVSFSASQASITRGNPTTLTWSSTNANTCSIDNNIGSVSLSGSKAVSPNSNTTYKLTCSGAGGGLEAQASVAVGNPPPAPTASFSANQSSIIKGNSVTLSWTSANTTSCSIDRGIGNVVTAGSKIVSPTETTTYTLSCSGADGQIQPQATVNVVLPAPDATFSANPSIILSGSPVTLSWSSSNATQCSIDQGIGSVATSSSKTITPPVGTITYSLNCSGSGGSIPKQATVNVGSPEPSSAALTVASPVALPGALDRFANFITFSTRFAKLGDVALTPASPQFTGSAIQISASAAAGSGNYEYAFWLISKESGSQWGLVRSYSNSAQFTWTSSQPGNYVLGVAIRNSGSSREAEDFKEIEYTVNRRPDPITIQSFTVSPAGSAQVGNSVSLSASATGGTGSLVYSFGIKGSWSEIKGYASAGSGTWNTSGLTPGTYILSARAKSQDSSAVFDTERDISYTLNAPPPITNSFTAESPVVNYTYNTSLIWSVAEDVSKNGCTLDYFERGNNTSVIIGRELPSSGYRAVGPYDSTLYTLTCTGPSGQVQLQTTVGVRKNGVVLPAPGAIATSGIITALPSPPTISVSFNPPVYSDAQPATTFSWSVSNANTCILTTPTGRQFNVNSKQGTDRWGAAANLGNSITETLACTGPGGSATAQATATKNISPPATQVVTQSLPPQCVVAKSSYPAAGSIINENAPINVCTEAVDSSCANPGMRCVLMIGYMGF